MNQELEVKSKRLEYMAQRRADPEFKAKRKDYMAERYKDPEFKSKRMEYSQKPEVKLRKNISGRIRRNGHSERLVRPYLDVNDPEYEFKQDVRRRADRYNTEEQFMYDLIKRGACDLCGSNIKLCVDHCHESGLVRGLLCNKCNSAIGFLGDSVEGLNKAINYLKGKYL